MDVCKLYHTPLLTAKPDESHNINILQEKKIKASQFNAEELIYKNLHYFNPWAIHVKTC